MMENRREILQYIEEKTFSKVYGVLGQAMHKYNMIEEG